MGKQALRGSEQPIQRDACGRMGSAGRLSRVDRHGQTGRLVRLPPLVSLGTSCKKSRVLERAVVARPMAARERVTRTRRSGSCRG